MLNALLAWPLFARRGRWAVAEQIGSVLKLFPRRYGLNKPAPCLYGVSFRRPSLDGQMGLWDSDA